jgi:hypothetical protein
MCDVAEQQRISLGGDLGENAEIDRQRITARTGDNYSRAKLARQPPRALVIYGTGHLIDAEAAHGVVGAGDVLCVAVAVVPAGRHVEAHQPVARVQQCPKHSDIGYGRGQRLDVSVLGPENRLGTLNGKLLDRVHGRAAVE